MPQALQLQVPATLDFKNTVTRKMLAVMIMCMLCCQAAGFRTRQEWDEQLEEFDKNFDKEKARWKEHHESIDTRWEKVVGQSPLSTRILDWTRTWYSCLNSQN